MTKKYTQEDVVKIYAEQGYELISEYVNSNIILFVKDKDGYICNSYLKSFKNGSEPYKFHKSNPYTIQNIKLWMKTNAIGYELISIEYKGSHEKLIFKCPKGHKFEMEWNAFQQGHRCKTCSGNTKHMYEYIKEYFEKEEYELLSKEYINGNTKLKVICPHGHKYEITFNAFQQGHRCKTCIVKKVTPETCIATTDPWMVKFLKNKEDAYNYSHGSNRKVDVICPNCGTEKKMQINNLYRYKSIGCKRCGDGVSYPEKFIIELLNQLNIKYEREYKPEWIGKKRYDFYLPNCNTIIECHGKQHYNCSFKSCGGRTLEEEQKNDKYKKELALNNGISNYIELDCRESNLTQIKNSVLNSRLNTMFDLSNVNWTKCEEFAINFNLTKKACDYWKLHNEINNESLTTIDVGKVFNLDRTTISTYLKRGQFLGWCNYNGKMEQIKASSRGGKVSSKPIEIFKDGKSLGIFPSCSELAIKSEELFGVKLLSSMISNVCNGKRKTHKGFTFRYITKEEYNERK